MLALLIGSIVKRLRHPARTEPKRLGEMVSTLDESLSGIKVIKSYNAIDYIKKEIFRHQRRSFAVDPLDGPPTTAGLADERNFSALRPLVSYWFFGGSLVMNGSLDAGGFIAFIAMFSQITRPVRTFIDQFATINPRYRSRRTYLLDHRYGQ